MLKQNLEILKDKNPGMAKEVINKGQMENLNIIKARNGSLTGIIDTGDTSILLHSKYNPEREAQRLVDQVDYDKATSIIVFGFGFGYHLLQLYEKVMDRDIKVFVIDNNPGLVKEALKYNDFRKIIGSPNFYFLIKEEIANQELFDFIDNNIDLVFEELEFLKLPSADKYSGQFSVLFYEVMTELLSKIIGNKATTIKDGKTWNFNLLKNLSVLIKNPGYVRFKGFASGKPAIIVAAGPSLEKNVNHLKKVKNKALIIAIDASLKTLLEKNIIPDILVVLDGKKQIFKFFDRIDNAKLKNTVLLACPKVQPKIFNDWPGPKIIAPTFIEVTEDYILRWFEQYIENKGRIPSGGSVAHLAFVFAYYMQSDPIIFVGQDLALTDNYTHTKGNALRRTVEEDMRISKKKYMKIKDIHGNPVWTRADFYNFLQWYNRNIKVIKDLGSNIKFIDATEGGARIEGTELMTLEEAIEKYCTEEIDVKDRLLKEILSFSPGYNEKLFDGLEKVINDLEKIKKLSEKGLNIIDQLIDFAPFSGESASKFYKQLEDVNIQINRIKNNIVFFESEVYDVYLNRDFFKGDMQELNQAVDLYNRFISGSTKAIGILKENYKLIKEEL